MTRPPSPCSCCQWQFVGIDDVGQIRAELGPLEKHGGVGLVWWLGSPPQRASNSDIGVGGYQVLGDRRSKNVGSGRLGAIHWRAGAHT